MSNVYIKRYVCTINSYMFHNYFEISREIQRYQGTLDLLNSEKN